MYRSSEATWRDRQYPFRIDLFVLIDPSSPIDFRPLIPRVGFLPRKDEKWGTILQTSCLEISDSDVQLLISTIKAAQAIPQLYPAAAESPEEYHTGM